MGHVRSGRVSGALRSRRTATSDVVAKHASLLDVRLRRAVRVARGPPRTTARAIATMTMTTTTMATLAQARGWARLFVHARALTISIYIYIRMCMDAVRNYFVHALEYRTLQ